MGGLERSIYAGWSSSSFFPQVILLVYRSYLICEHLNWTPYNQLFFGELFFFKIRGFFFLVALANFFSVIRSISYYTNKNWNSHKQPVKKIDCQYRNQYFLYIIEIQPGIRQKKFAHFHNTDFILIILVFVLVTEIDIQTMQKVFNWMKFQNFFSYILNNIWIRTTFFKQKDP